MRLRREGSHSFDATTSPFIVDTKSRPHHRPARNKRSPGVRRLLAWLARRPTRRVMKSLISAAASGHHLSVDAMRYASVASMPPVSGAGAHHKRLSFMQQREIISRCECNIACYLSYIALSLRRLRRGALALIKPAVALGEFVMAICYLNSISPTISPSRATMSHGRGTIVGSPSYQPIAEMAYSRVAISPSSLVFALSCHGTLIIGGVSAIAERAVTPLTRRRVQLS